MSVKKRRLTEAERKSEASKFVIREGEYINAANTLAMHDDINKRYGQKDISVDNMFARKKKPTKSKTNRTRKKKGCRCK